MASESNAKSVHELEAALRESEARYRSMLDLNPAATVLLDSAGRLLDGNARVEGLLGYNLDDLRGQIVFEQDFMTEESRGIIRERLADSMRGIKHEPYEVGFVRRDGEPLRGQVISTPLRDADGNVSRVLAMVLDVTEQRRAERTMRENEERYRSLLDMSPYAVTILQEGNIVFCNETTARMLGYDSTDQLVGQSMLHGVPEREQSRMASYVQARLAGREDVPDHYETALLRRNGTEVPVEVYVRKMTYRGRSAEQVVLVDISSRRQQEIALSRRDAVLGAVRTAAELFLTSGGWRQNISKVLESLGRAADVSRVYIFENEEGEEGEPAMSQRYEWVRPGVTAEIDNPGLQGMLYKTSGFGRWLHLMAQGATIHGNVSSFPDGERRVLDTQEVKSLLAVPIFVAGEWWGFIGFDNCLEECAWSEGVMSALQAAASTLGAAIEHENSREDQMRLSAAIEQTGEGVAVTDGEGRILYVNPAFASITGWRPEEALGKALRDLCYADLDEEVHDVMRSTVLNGMVWKDRLHIPDGDGTPRAIETTVNPIRSTASHQISNWVAVMRDVSHEASLEQRLRRSQKMEAIGTLAGGIAHDFNNILSAIIGYTSIAVSEVEEDTSLHQSLRQVEKAGRRAADLVRQILTFTRQTEQPRQPLYLQSIAKEVLKLLRGSLPATIDVEPRIDGSVGPILGDPTAMHQVLMNLCTNAYQAMRDTGGTLRVELDEIEVQEGEPVDAGEVHPGRYARLSIRDTGHGMEESTRERIFDPYFTTRSAGEGTGLGLSTVHGIVKNHEGAIRVTSTPEKGTMFRVMFPIRYPQDAQGASASMKKAMRGGDETILFVDDEEAIALLGKMVLQPLGYTVESHTSSIDALRAWREAPERYDLVITDQTMPGMTGMEMAALILETLPGQPIILCTGYSESVTEDSALSAGIRAFLLKPLITPELAAAIRRVLDEPDKTPSE